jgi:RNA polymerase sigma-70 factor (ECF subfamily)
VFLAVASGIDGFSHDRPGDSFRKWLKTIALNKIRDYWRRQQREPQGAGGTDAQILMAQQAAEAESNQANQSETNFLLRQALEMVRAEFEPTTWKAFCQTVLDGRATTDVAADLEVTANAIRIAKSRILSRLRQEFGELLK